MTEFKKFLFDNNDFSKSAMETVVITYSEEEYLTAKNQSFLQGKEEGIKETRQQQEEKITHALQKALQTIDTLIQDENRREVEKTIKATELSMLVIKKILPDMAEKYSLKEIENTIISNVKAKKDEPRINVFINEQNLEFIKKRIDEEVKRNNYSNQINITSDPSLTVTDCKVEWADGGAERLFDDLLKQIETAIQDSIKGLEIEKENQ